MSSGNACKVRTPSPTRYTQDAHNPVNSSSPAPSSPSPLVTQSLESQPSLAPRHFHYALETSFVKPQKSHTPIMAVKLDGTGTFLLDEGRLCELSCEGSLRLRKLLC